MSTETITLPGSILYLEDKRRLCYAVWGDPNGIPLVFFHGTPGSRMFRPPDETILTALGIRFVTVDRPGYGKSDPEPRRTLLGWPEDVARLADHLGLEDFAVAGVSGGGPHALACGYRLPDRVRMVGLLGSIAPLDRPGSTDGMNPMNRRTFAVASKAPWLVRVGSIPTGYLARRHPERFAENVASQFSEPDQRVMRRPEVREMDASDLAEAFAQGGRGLASDLVVVSKPWGFAPEALTTPVKLWQGAEDRNVPPSQGDWLAARISDCEMVVFNGEGHLFFHERWAEILRALTQSPRG